ncbi:MAG: CBS domain-containing protein [Ghiorsea sp.]
MQDYTTTPDALLSEVFRHSSNHALVVLEDDRIAGVLQMRDVLSAYIQFGDIADLKVSDYMIEDVISIENTQNNLQVARKFANHKIKSLVVAKNGKFINCVDPQQAIPLLPLSLPGFFQPASQNMIVNPYTITPEATVHDAISMMARCRISCLPVVNDHEETVGMLSESDAVACVYDDDCSKLVAEAMTAPALTCPSHASLRQCWDLMVETKVMKLLMVHDDGRLHGLLTVTDVLVGLCRSLLSVFHAYHCPQDTDMMVEWRKHGMIMAASEHIYARLGYTSEELVGLDWQAGCRDEDIEKLLKLNKGETHAFVWELDGAGLPFVASRDGEQASMFWKLEEQ